MLAPYPSGSTIRGRTNPSVFVLIVGVSSLPCVSVDMSPISLGPTYILGFLYPLPTFVMSIVSSTGSMSSQLAYNAVALAGIARS